MITITCGSARGAGDCAMSVAVLDDDGCARLELVAPQAATVAISAAAATKRVARMLGLGAPAHQVPPDQSKHDHHDDHIDDDLFGTEHVEREHENLLGLRFGIAAGHG
jgi:hypothetical protein